MWSMTTNAEFEKRVRKWPKKYKRELAAMLEHLETIHRALQLGAKVEHLSYGFVHREPGGVLALDQKGGGQGLKETRLYVYPDKDGNVLHLITLGDKSSQEDDIAFCNDYLAGLKEGN